VNLRSWLKYLNESIKSEIVVVAPKVTVLPLMDPSTQVLVNLLKGSRGEPLSAVVFYFRGRKSCHFVSDEFVLVFVVH